MNNSDGRWIAAIFDTEGSFSLTKGRHIHADRPAKRGFTWTPKAHVINTSVALIDELVKISSGMGKVFHRPGRNGGKEQWTWTLRNPEVKKLLPQITPFLVVKRRQAELLLDAVEMFDVCRGLGANPITPIRDRRLETIFWEMRKLNAKREDGLARVEAEERASGHVPYNREQWLEDSARVRQETDDSKYQNQLRISREWKRTHKKEVADYWAGYSASHRAVVLG